MLSFALSLDDRCLIKFFTASLVPLHSRGCYAAWLQLTLLLIINVRWESRKIHWNQKLCRIVDYAILFYNCVNWFERKQLSRKKILNGRIEIIYIFIFCRKYCSFTKPIMVTELLSHVRKNTLKSSSSSLWCDRNLRVMWWIRSRCQWRFYHFQCLTTAIF